MIHRSLYAVKQNSKSSIYDVDWVFGLVFISMIMNLSSNLAPKHSEFFVLELLGEYHTVQHAIPNFWSELHHSTVFFGVFFHSAKPETNKVHA